VPDVPDVPAASEADAPALALPFGWRARRSGHALPEMRKVARKRAQQRRGALLARIAREVRLATG